MHNEPQFDDALESLSSSGLLLLGQEILPTLGMPFLETTWKQSAGFLVSMPKYQRPCQSKKHLCLFFCFLNCIKFAEDIGDAGTWSEVVHTLEIQEKTMLIMPTKLSTCEVTFSRCIGASMKKSPVCSCHIGCLSSFAIHCNVKQYSIAFVYPSSGTQSAVTGHGSHTNESVLLGIISCY